VAIQVNATDKLVIRFQEPGGLWPLGFFFEIYA